MTFGSQVDQSVARRMIDTCLDRGIDFFDTANVYNKGESESILGACLAGRRNRVIVASKVRGKMPDGTEGLSRAAIAKGIEGTLERMRTDYLDLYYLHQPDYNVPIEETLDAMEQLVRAGKVRFPALSNYSGWQVAEAQCIAGKKQYTPATVSQPMYNLLARGIEQEYLPMCQRFGIATCVYNPLAGGLLSGKQNIERPETGSRFDNNQMYLDRYWHPAYFEAVDELKKAADAHARSLISVALNWIWHHTPADCVILGASKIEQLEQNLNALEDGPLPDQLLKRCDSIGARLRGVTPKYNR